MEKREITPNNEDKKSFWRKAKDTMVKAVDQNDDGTFDKEDISAIAESIGSSAKNTYESVKMKAEAHRLEKERKQLAPIFANEIADPDSFYSKLLRITTIDKKRAESDVCRDSIGYLAEQKDFKIVNLYKDKLSESGLSFFPNAESELYYVDPIDKRRYIAFEQYFSYLKEARVNELELIAQELGAKHFKVSFKGAKSSSEHYNANHNLKAMGKAGNAETERDRTAHEASTIEVAAESYFPGHTPVQPKLHYLQYESCIQTLISQRMHTESPILHKKYTIKLSNSSGIKEKDAVMITAALKGMNFSESTKIAKEIQNESTSIFEYEIDF